VPQKRFLAPILLAVVAACSDAPQVTSPVLAFENPQYSLGLPAEASAETLMVGETIQLRASLPTSRGRTRATGTSWTSQNSSVATVSSTGLVTATASGTTLIVASNNLAAESATIRVNSPVVVPTPAPMPPPAPPVIPATPAGTLAVELPRVFLDDMVASARNASRSRTISVSTSAAFLAALDTSKYGDDIVLQAGVTYTGPFTLRRKSGSGWITIRSSALGALPAGQRVRPAYAGQLARLVSFYPMEPVISTEAGASRYHLAGLEVTTNPGVSMTGALVSLGSAGGDQNTIASQPFDLVLDRLYIHGTPTLDFRRCLALNSGATALVDSWLGECHGRSFESQAIWGSNGTGPYKIVNNMLEGAGENVMFGGSDPKIPNTLPSDIEFRRNHVYKPLSWKGVWSVKNSFELKIGRRMLVEGNVFENNWIDAQIGFAIVLKSTNQENSAPWSQTSDVTFQYNIVRGSPHAVTLSANPESAPAQPTSRIRIAHNSFEATDPSGRVIQTQGIQGLSIENNAGFGGFNGFIVHGASHTNFTAINNIFGSGSNFVASADGRGIGTEGLNAHAGPNWVFRRNVIVGARSNAYPSDNFYPASVGLVGFLNSSINFALSGSSPYVNSGTDGRAVGPNYTALASATAGVIVSP